MNSPDTALLAKAAREQQHAELQLSMFEHLLHHMPALMRPVQVAACVGWKRRTIYEMCEAGLLDCHTLPGRAKTHRQITRRSVAALLLRTARYSPADFPKLLALTLPTMTPEQLQQFRAELDSEIRRRA